MDVKQLVKELYLDKRYSCKELYNILKTKGYTGSRQYVNKILSQIPEYVGRQLEIENTINELYFKKKYSATEIANELNVSVSFITRTLNLSGSKYIEEKEKRKKCTKKIRELKRNNSKNSEDDIVINQLKNLQAANAIAMSNKSKLTDKGIVEMFINHYDLDKKKKRLVFNESCGAKPIDVPRSIKISINSGNIFMTYTPGIDGKKLNK